MQETCKCNRTERIASVAGVNYLRCVDCNRIFEAEDLDPVPVYDDDDQDSR